VHYDYPACVFSPFIAPQVILHGALFLIVVRLSPSVGALFHILVTLSPSVGALFHILVTLSSLLPSFGALLA
jgi:hypothetical protein